MLKKNLQKFLRITKWVIPTMVLFLLFIPHSFAANFVVNSTADDDDANPGDLICDIGNGDCTLPAALTESLFNPASDVITLPSGTYHVSNANLFLGSGDLTINGTSSSNTIITNAGTNVFLVDGPGIHLSLNDLKISNVLSSTNLSPIAIFDPSVTVDITNCIFNGNGIESFEDQPNYGGVIYNMGTLNVTNSTFSNNVSTAYTHGDMRGAVIYNTGGTVVITNSTFSNNQALVVDTGGASGGAIQSENGGSVTITGSTFSGNIGGGGGAIKSLSDLSITDTTFSNNNATSGNLLGSGGAIDINGGNVVLTNNTFSGNHGYAGGAIRNSSSVSLTITGSTFSGNTAIDGGAIANYDNMTVSNTTFFNNSVTQDVGTYTGYGGAIFNSTNTNMILNHLTVVGNNAQRQGGGISLGEFGGDTAVVTIKNSIITQNTHTGAVADDCAGFLGELVPTVISQGVNILSTVANTTGCTGWTGSDMTNVADPLLDTLAVNAPGNTATMKLLVGSPAIDAIAVDTATEDQRGAVRPQGVHYDVGAYELDSDLSLTLDDTHDSPGDPVSIDQPLTYTATITNNSLYLSANGVTVADNNPANLNIASWTCSVTGTGSCSSGDPGPVVGHLTGVTVDLDPGDVATFVITAAVSHTAASNVNYTVTLTPPNGYADGNSSNNAITDTDYVRAVLSETTPVNPSDTDTTPSFTLNSTQAGTISAVGGDPDCAITNPPAIDIGDNVLTFDAFPVGFTYHCTITLQDATNGVDSNTLPLTGFEITDVLPGDIQVDIGVSNSDNETVVEIDQPLTYVVTVSNNSVENVSGILLTDSFPAGLTNVSWVCDITSGTGSCTNANGVGNITAESINLNTGATATFTVSADVTHVAASNIVNTASVAMPNGYANTDVLGGADTDTDQVRASITEAVPVNASDTDTTPDFTLNSTQAGTVTVVGGDADCAITNPPAISIGDNVLTFDAFPAGATYNCTIIIQDQSHGNDSNELHLTAFEITQPPADVDVDVSISNSDGQNIVSVNQSLTYSINIVNSSLTDVPGIHLTDTFPAGLTNITWTCQISNGTGNCGNANGVGNITAESIDIDASSSAIFTVFADVTGGAASDIINTASVVMPNGYNNTGFGNGTSTDTDQVRASLVVVTPVPTPSLNTTPSFTFSSTQAGIISYSGACSSNNNLAGIGNNVVTFDALAPSTYNNCQVIVHDITHNNASNTLDVPSFKINAPAVAGVGGGGGGGSGGGGYPYNDPKADDGKKPASDTTPPNNPPGTTPPTQEPPVDQTVVPFSDTQDHWAKKDIEQLQKKCSITGYTDASGNALNTFKPDQVITRAELVTLLTKCEFGSLSPAAKSRFIDVPLGHFAAPAIEKAAEKGLVKGYPGRLFKPDQNATRAEGLAMILRFFAPNDEVLKAPKNTQCSDLSLDAWYMPYFNFALNMHIISGYRDATGKALGICSPELNISRAEVAAIVVNSMAHAVSK